MEQAPKNNELSRVECEEIKKFIPFVHALIRTRNYVGNLSYDEKYSAGLFGIAAGLARFDPSRGSDLTQWIYCYVDYYIRNEAAKEYKQKRLVLFGEQEECEDKKAKSPPDVMELEELGIFKHYFRFLDARTRRIVYFLCVEKRTNRELAVREKLSPSRVSQIYQKGLRKLERLVRNERDFNDLKKRENE
ncbi:MAG: hypothetical protein Q4C95_11885 [Planctomycetia bacterium]|nr:hypothetical protein [Planctomycetia bacterium]